MSMVFPIGRLPAVSLACGITISSFGFASLLAQDLETGPTAQDLAAKASSAEIGATNQTAAQETSPPSISGSQPVVESVRNQSESASQSRTPVDGGDSDPSAAGDRASAHGYETHANRAEAFARLIDDLQLFSPRLLREFYAARAFRPAWGLEQAEAMRDLAQESLAHGLRPRDFNAGAIEALLATSELEQTDDAVSRWRADLILSDALLRYLHHLQYGKYNPKEINPEWTFVDTVEAGALQAEMHDVLAANDLSAAVAAVLPKAPFYEQLKLGYARYLSLRKRLQREGDWAPIPPGPNLKIGMRDSRLPRIRDQLALLDGYEFPHADDPDIYDQALYEALREFQGRSGLAQDGVIGPRTLAALNHPFEERLAVIRANLERMRWLYHELPADYLLVDIAAFQLELVRDHEPVWSTRVVVGTDEDQTPMFRDEMEHLVFNPTWSVPRSIQKKLRGVSGDYKVVDRRTGRRVYPSNPTNSRRYRLVQQPGPKNALGRVKFMFPNGHAIYLHDTPSRHLFARSRRSYSHGCVRVEKPLELAREILASEDWDMSAIKRVVAKRRTRYVNLDAHLPVLLYYLTARADEQGRVGFRTDIYGRDRSLLASLDGPPGTDRIVFSEAPATESERESVPTSAQRPSTPRQAAERIASNGVPETETKPTTNPSKDADPDSLKLEPEAPRAEQVPEQTSAFSARNAPAGQQGSRDSVEGLPMTIRAASSFPVIAAPPVSASAFGQRDYEYRNGAALDLDRQIPNRQAQGLHEQGLDARRLDLRRILMHSQSHDG